MTKVTFLSYRGSGLAGTLTRWQTRSPYAHTAILFDGVVWEAKIGKGVVKRMFGNLDLLADRFSIEVNEYQFGMGYAWLSEQLGKPYDLMMVLRFISRRQEAREAAGKWFCSELAFAFAVKMGVRLLERVEPWEVSPGLLTKSPLLAFEGAGMFPGDKVEDSPPAWG